MDLFEHAQRHDPGALPFAEAVRPSDFDGFFGQGQLTDAGRMLRDAVERDRVPSLILWGPPGTGKTTLARIIAGRCGHHFAPFSAVLGGVKDIRRIVAEARDRRRMYRRGTLLFIDEIHRFNKSQQDALLPHVEDGTVTLIGATTENPSFELNAALLSRARVVVLERLRPDALRQILARAAEHPVRQQRWPAVPIDPAALDALAELADGDARRALGAFELALDRGAVSVQTVSEAIDKKLLTYDKAGDGHYQAVSAFIKSMRGTDPDAAVYWMQRMIEAGEDPLFVLRRMVIFASEDVGLADPQALPLAMAAVNAFRFVGLPEGMFTLIHLATYLASAPKSNTVLTTLAAARTAVKQHGNLPVPRHLRPQVTRLQKQMARGAKYRYPHEFDGGYAPQHYLPDALQGQVLFAPQAVGAEAAVKQRVDGMRAQAKAALGLDPAISAPPAAGDPQSSGE